jgi:uncharacterized membrane protein YccC
VTLARRLLQGRDLVQELRLAVKMAAGGTAAWAASSALGASRPVFAVLVPLVGLSGDPFSAVSVSVDRILGIFAGVGIGIALVHGRLDGTLAVAIALAAGSLVGIVLRVGSRPNIQASISALFMLGVAGSERAGVARVWETAVGAVITIALAILVWPPDPARELRLRLARLRQALATDLSAVADDLATGSGAADAHLEAVREHSLDAIREYFDVDTAKHALRWNPLRRGDAAELADLERRTALAARLYRHARALTRDVADVGTRSPSLAAVTRHVADASDRALAGEPAGEALDRAEALLAGDDDPVLQLQLRQVVADLRLRAD